MIFTKEMEKVADELEKRGISASSIKLYMKHLTKIAECINGNPQFNNLNFLKQTTAVGDCLNNYAVATRKTMLGSILSVVKDHPKKQIAKLHKTYTTMLEENVIPHEKPKNSKSDTQKENWLDWDEVMEIRNDLWNHAKDAYAKKNINGTDYDTLLHNVILSLYTDQIAPRRNEYMYMYIVPKGASTDDNDKNYLVIDDKKPSKLIFNNYKTKKAYGSQEFDIEDDRLKNSIQMYLKYHPVYSSIRNRKTYEIPFLVNQKGLPLSNINAITRVLNKIFRPKKIGASMLRHSYLSSKYNINDMKEDANEMGHSVNQQKQYLLEDSDSE